MFDFQCSTTLVELEEHLKLRGYQEVWMRALLDETNFELQQLSEILVIPNEQEKFSDIPQGSILDFLDSISQEALEFQKERKTPEELQVRYQKLIYHRTWLQDLLRKISWDIQATKIVSNYTTKRE